MWTLEKNNYTIHYKIFIEKDSYIYRLILQQLYYNLKI